MTDRSDDYLLVELASTHTTTRVWFDEASTCTTPVAPAEPDYTEQLEARGLRVLTDDEVIDKGDYVLWKDYDPKHTVLLEAPFILVLDYDVLDKASPSYTESIAQLKPVAHRSKPLRIKTGLFYSPDRSSHLFYVNRRGTQCVWRWDGGYARTSSMHSVITNEFAEGRVEIPMRLAPGDIRREYTNNLVDRVYDINPTFASARAAGFARLRRRSPSTTATYRGELMSGVAFLLQKKRLKLLGELIRDADSTSSSEVIAALERVDDRILEHIRHRVVDAWNERQDGYGELEVASCGHIVEEGDTHSTHDGEVCQDCFDNYVYVENTEDYRVPEDVYEHSDGCYYTYEEDDDEDNDEDEDEDEHAGGCVRNYSTNVLNYHPADYTVRVSPYGEFLMGVELEVMPLEGSRRDAAQHTNQTLCEGYAILKNDGSLCSRDEYASGFEIVTAPRGLAEHIKRFTEWVPDSQLRAWDPGNCGMHVHMSSAAFTASTLGKFIEFINARENLGLIKAIAGRHPEENANAANYCQRDGNLSLGNPKKTIEGKSTSRYLMINTTNLDYEETKRLGLSSDHAQKGINTIELRIFRATLSKPRLLAQLEFAHAAVMFCRWSSMRELRGEHFINWLRESAGSYPHLAKWFGVKANKREVDPAPAVRQLAEV